MKSAFIAITVCAAIISLFVATIFMIHPSGLIGQRTALPNVVPYGLQEPTLADYVSLNGQEPDLHSPAVTLLTPGSGSFVPVGGELTVQLQAIDDHGIGSVTVSFDLDGDGTTTGPDETVQATLTGPDTYQAVFAGVSGATGTRTVRIEADDTSGNFKTNTRDVSIYPR